MCGACAWPPAGVRLQPLSAAAVVPGDADADGDPWAEELMVLESIYDSQFAVQSEDAVRLTLELPEGCQLATRADAPLVLEFVRMAGAEEGAGSVAAYPQVPPLVCVSCSGLAAGALRHVTRVMAKVGERRRVRAHRWPALHAGRPLSCGGTLCTGRQYPVPEAYHVPCATMSGALRRISSPTSSAPDWGLRTCSDCHPGLQEAVSLLGQPMLHDLAARALEEAAGMDAAACEASAAEAEGAGEQQEGQQEGGEGEEGLGRQDSSLVEGFEGLTVEDEEEETGPEDDGDKGGLFSRGCRLPLHGVGTNSALLTRCMVPGHWRATAWQRVPRAPMPARDTVTLLCCRLPLYPLPRALHALQPAPPPPPPPRAAAVRRAPRRLAAAPPQSWRRRAAACSACSPTSPPRRRWRTSAARAPRCPQPPSARSCWRCCGSTRWWWSAGPPAAARARRWV